MTKNPLKVPGMFHREMRVYGKFIWNISNVITQLNFESKPNIKFWEYEIPSELIKLFIVTEKEESTKINLL